MRGPIKLFAVLLLLGHLGCDRNEKPKAAKVSGNDSKPASLMEARRSFQTKLIEREASNETPDDPPPELFRLVKYRSEVGELAAYLSAAPKDQNKHPAIIWIHGGDSNSIGDVWDDRDRKNDQSAGQYREANIVMMYPALRGGNGGPGKRESFFGEVDDVLAATNYLASQPFVDPQRIYLGGHSTGGTVVMLVAAASSRYRAVFSFGPVEDVSGYGSDYLRFDDSNPKEVELRSPGKWIGSIQSPTFVFEGTINPSNIDSLRAMKSTSTNPLVKFYPVAGASHFSILAPVNQMVAQRILQDSGPQLNIDFNDKELTRLFEEK